MTSNFCNQLHTYLRSGVPTSKATYLDLPRWVEWVSRAARRHSRITFSFSRQQERSIPVELRQHHSMGFDAQSPEALLMG
jgi:hypothetical protein